VYDADQLYPEYIILYQRTFASTDPAELEAQLKFPLHMQLPVYWRNCHRNPLTDPFNDQFYVRKTTLNLLQRIVLACTTNDRPRVVAARRIESFPHIR